MKCHERILKQDTHQQDELNPGVARPQEHHIGKPEVDRMLSRQNINNMMCSSMSALGLTLLTLRLTVGRRPSCRLTTCWRRCTISGGCRVSSGSRSGKFRSESLDDMGKQFSFGRLGQTDECMRSMTRKTDPREPSYHNSGRTILIENGNSEVV